MQKYIHVSIFLIILALWLFFAAKSVQAQAMSDYASVYVTEIMPNPDGSDTDYEWIEIFNSGEETIDLSVCTLDDRSFPQDTSIESEQYLVIAKDLLDDDEDEQSFEYRWGNGSNIWGDSEDEQFGAIDMNITMRNSDDYISLICEDYEDSVYWEQALSGQSFSLTEEGNWTDSYRVTPGHENEEIPEIVYPYHIRISEVYPTPSDEETEWIELYNYGETDMDLNGWKLEDTTKIQVLETTTISAHSHLVIDGDVLSISLNNSGERILLYDPNDEEVDVFVYEQTDEKISNIRKWKKNRYGDEIVQTQEVTRGSKNTLVDPDDHFYHATVVSICEAKTKELGTEVAIQGVITVGIGLLRSKVFYVQDATGGMQIYLSDESIWQDFTLGDELQIIGILKETRDEYKVYVQEAASIKKITTEKQVSVGSVCGIL